MPIDQNKAWDTSMLRYGDELKARVEKYPHANVLELGAGRRPSFSLDEMPSSLVSYTVNGISKHELALLSEGCQKAWFDVSGDAAAFRDRYDVVFSRFLVEQVPNGQAVHSNVYSVLSEGGAAFHLIPRLYALLFAIYKLMPEGLTGSLLKHLSPRRLIKPKFPAYYSACYRNPDKMKLMLGNIGHSHVEVRNFYGHFYYEQIPILKQMHERFSTLAADRDWHFFSTYAYIKAYR